MGKRFRMFTVERTALLLLALAMVAFVLVVAIDRCSEPVASATVVHIQAVEETDTVIARSDSVKSGRKKKSKSSKTAPRKAKEKKPKRSHLDEELPPIKK